MQFTRIFKVEQTLGRAFKWGDVVVLGLLAVAAYVGVQLAFAAPAVINGPNISLAPGALPLYTALSLGRMAAAYILSMAFTLIYGSAAARSRRAERVMLPLLDVLQSVPILSFLPVVFLSLNALLPERAAGEVASIVLIFTSQVWNLTFAWYQALGAIPKELREASTIFRLPGWMQFKTLALPFAAIPLIWNSMMSWAGGWFFLMAAEIFTVGRRDLRLPGLGAYLQQAASKGDVTALAYGIGTLVLVIVALDQLVWRPLLAWSDRFKIEMTEGDNPPTSWFYDLARTARVTRWFFEKVGDPLTERADQALSRISPAAETLARPVERRRLIDLLGWLAVAGLLMYGLYRIGGMLTAVNGAAWGGIGLGLAATFLRVLVVLALALLWTIPVGVAIGTNPRLATVLQPVVQIMASVPATALFPAFLLLLIKLPAGLTIAAILLMLMGTQWYILFNVIAGAASIPQDLKYTARLLHLGRWERWRTLILPALFPFIITGLVTASGGAWNASIVAEHVEFAGETFSTAGIGSQIAQATAKGDYPLLLASTLCMILTVVLINRLVWRRLYNVAHDQYRME
jgi:NitT/TauT family transport system permease protein